MNEAELDESLEQPKIEEPLPGLTSGLRSAGMAGLNPHLSAEILVASSPAPVQPGPMWRPWAYALEFLIALLAIMSLWSEIGGQVHLDLMPWYVKLVCIIGLAWCCIRLTASMVEQQEFWSRRTIVWLAGVILFSIAMGGITYYYHLQESDDGEQDTSTARLSMLDSKSFCR